MKITIKVLAVLALVLLPIIFPAPDVWSRPSFDPAKVTADTFLFSDFIEKMLKIGQYGNDVKTNSVLGEMRDTLLRLYPPGTNIEEFFTFFEQVARRELKNTRSIEDQSAFRMPPRSPSDRTKIGYVAAAERDRAIADYHYELKFFRTVLIEPRAALAAMSGGGFYLKFQLSAGKISDLSITKAHSN
jgi:hypothetical protein